MNFNDPSKLPNHIKFVAMAATFIGTLAIGFYLDTLPQREALATLEAKEVDLRTAFLDKKRQAVNLDAHRKQLAEIEIAFGTLLRQLPNKSEMDALLNDINQAGVAKGLSFNLFKPSPNEIKTDFYAELPVDISVSGSFSQFGSFSEEISKLSRIVNLDNVNLHSTNDPKTLLGGEAPKMTITGVARTYRYLDPKEIEQQRAAKKGKKH